jgi:hemolysin-activating ACP:hemolysin acyltransferase
MSKLIFHNGQWVDKELETERYVKSEEWRSGDTAWAAAIIGAGVGALLVIAQIYIGFLIG